MYYVPITMLIMIGMMDKDDKWWMVLIAPIVVPILIGSLLSDICKNTKK